MCLHAKRCSTNLSGRVSSVKRTMASISLRRPLEEESSRHRRYSRSRMKILVVEDEAKTAAYLTNGLSEHGFVVDMSGHGEYVLHLALTGSYDLVILDVMLPQRDGWSVLARLRESDRSTPVLFLTARDAVSD